MQNRVRVPGNLFHRRIGRNEQLLREQKVISHAMKAGESVAWKGFIDLHLWSHKLSEEFFSLSGLQGLELLVDFNDF